MKDYEKTLNKIRNDVILKTLLKRDFKNVSADDLVSIYSSLKSSQEYKSLELHVKTFNILKSDTSATSEESVTSEASEASSVVSSQTINRPRKTDNQKLKKVVRFYPIVNIRTFEEE